MDDLLASLDSEETTVTLKANLPEHLSRGGFKWATIFDKETTSDMSLTILGFEWDNTKDTLKVCRGMTFEPYTTWTQRKVLSVVSSLFDSLGFLAPFVI